MIKPIIRIVISICISLPAIAQVVNVHTSNELQTALNNAKPGHIITLDNNKTYSLANCTNCITNNGSGFKVPVGVNGIKNNPIKLVGSKSSIIMSNNISSKYGLHLQGNNYWVIQGFTVTNSSKCVMLDSSNYNVIDDLRITNSGYEALHLRKFSSFNTVSNCYIDSTGMEATAASKGYAEGIYVGTANSNWVDYSNNKVDTCNYNIITNNIFGDLIKSENIDIKEGTKGGEISYNTFNGKGINGNNSADKYVDIKGDHYTIKCNRGKNNSVSILNGFEVNINKITTKNGLEVNQNFGDYNTFSNNTLDMTGTTGHAIYVNSYSGVIHNTVCSNNIAINAASGLCNLATITCTTPACKVITTIDDTFLTNSNMIQVSPNPFSDELVIRSLYQNQEITSFQLMDLNGKTIINQKAQNSNNSFNTSIVGDGIYLLKINFANKSSEILKVVKQ